MFMSNKIPMYSSNFMPSFKESPEFEAMVDIISSHAMSIVVDPVEDFGYMTECKTCGPMQHGINETLHVAHMLLLHGMGDKAETLRLAAQDITERGDIGTNQKRGETLPETYLKKRADLIENQLTDD